MESTQREKQNKNPQLIVIQSSTIFKATAEFIVWHDLALPIMFFIASCAGRCGSYLHICLLSV